MTKDFHDKELKWKICLFRNRCPILDLNNGLFVVPYANSFDLDEMPSDFASHPDPSGLIFRQHFFLPRAT